MCEQEYRCVVCGKDLCDPKNRGDPVASDSEFWVCNDATCRAIQKPACGPYATDA